MKKFIVLIILTSLFSCETGGKINLEGNWLITEMTHDGKSVYPETINGPIRILYSGYENTEVISFKISDSTIHLPGFKSDQFQLKFSTDEQILTVVDNGYNSHISLVETIFVGNYHMTFSSRNKTLKLESNKTTINLISEKEIISNAIDNALDGI